MNAPVYLSAFRLTLTAASVFLSQPKRHEPTFYFGRVREFSKGRRSSPLQPADICVRLWCVCGNARGGHASLEYPERACRTIHDAGLRTSAASPFPWRV